MHAYIDLFIYEDHKLMKIFKCLLLILASSKVVREKEVKSL